MIDWNVFSAACKLVDHDITFEWGTKYLYLVPAEITRDKWEAYAEVCSAYEVPYRAVEATYKFYVTVPYLSAPALPVAAQRATEDVPIFSNMPWTGDTAPGVKHKPGARPNMSRRFRSLQACVDNLREYLDRAKIYSAGNGRGNLQIRRLDELMSDPFVVKWRSL